MSAMASQITGLKIVYSLVYSGADQSKHQSSASNGLCAGNSSVTGEFPAQRASNAENVSIWWRHHGYNNTDAICSWIIKWSYRCWCIFYVVLVLLVHYLSAVNALRRKFYELHWLWNCVASSGKILVVCEKHILFASGWAKKTLFTNRFGRPPSWENQELHGDVIKWKQFPRYWHLWGDSTGHRWISVTKASDTGLWCFLWSTPEQTG